MFVDGAAALNRVRWSHTGKEIATGDSEGQVQVFDVGEVSPSLVLSFSLSTQTCEMDIDLSLRTLNSVVSLQQICVPKADEWTRFVRTLAEINENRDEAEELANV